MRQVISGITAAVVAFLAAANTAHAQGEYFDFEGEAYPPITRTLTFRPGPDGYEETSDDINRLILVVPAEDPPTDAARAVAFADELFEQVAAPGLQQQYTAVFPQDFFVVPQELVYEVINNDMNTIRISIEHREEDQWGPIYTRQVVDYEERPGGAWERVSHEACLWRRPVIFRWHHWQLMCWGTARASPPCRR